MAFVIGLPVLQICLFCFSIGRPPLGLHLAVVNHELNNWTDPCHFNTNCTIDMLSCRYLSELQKYNVVEVSMEISLHKNRIHWEIFSCNQIVISGTLPR